MAATSDSSGNSAGPAGARRTGLATAGLPDLRDRVCAAWDDFCELAELTDLARPSRLPGWTAGDVVVHLGSWPEARTLSSVLAAARAPSAAPAPDQDRVNAAVVAAHRGAGREAILEALHDARETVEEVFRSGTAAELGAVQVDSLVGPLPVLSLVNAGSFELAVHALDLLPAGAPEPPPRLLLAGLGAVLDVTGALAYRRGLHVEVSAQTPDGGWAFRSAGDGWDTLPVPAGPVTGTAVLGPAGILLDISAGRAQVPPLLARQVITVQSMSSFLQLAPLVDAVPGLPGRGALRVAAAGLSGVGRLLDRQRRRG